MDVRENVFNIEIMQYLIKPILSLFSHIFV